MTGEREDDVNKPMTSVERRRIFDDSDLFSIDDDDVSTLQENISRLLSAEAYWREAVKNCKAEVDCGASSGMGLMCVFCEGEDTPRTIVSGDGIVVHRADCPWKLAQ